MRIFEDCVAVTQQAEGGPSRPTVLLMLEVLLQQPQTQLCRYHGSLQRLDVRHNKIASAPSCVGLSEGFAQYDDRSVFAGLTN